MSGARFRKNRGISLLELLVALAISGVVMFAAIILLRQPQQLIESTIEKTDEAAVQDLRARELVNRFSRSDAIRRGFFNCNNGNAALRDLLRSTTNFANTTITLPDTFSLAFSNFNSMAGLGTNDNEITVTSVNKYYPGAIVVVSSINQPNVGGVFQVIGLNAATSTLVVRNFPATTGAAGLLPDAFPAGYNCTVSGSLPLDQIKEHRGNHVFGQQASTFRVDLIQFAQYFKRDNKKIVGDKDLYEKVWPSSAGTIAAPEVKEIEGPVIYNVRALRAEGASWTRSDGPVTSDGDFRMNLVLEAGERSLANRNLAVEKRSQRAVAYSTRSTNQVNVGLVIIPTPATLNFPTCAVIATPMSDFLALSDPANPGESPYALLYRIRGVVGGNVTSAGLTVDFVSSGAGVRCWRESDITPGAPPTLDVTAASANTIILQGAPPLDTAICDFKEIMSMTGRLRFLDATTSSISDLSCASAGLPSGSPVFHYKGTETTSCTSGGLISFGTLVQHDVSHPSETRRGPALFTNALSCIWDSNPGVAQSCTPTPASGNLVSVNIRPDDIPEFALGGIPDVVTCTP